MVKALIMEKLSSEMRAAGNRFFLMEAAVMSVACSFEGAVS